MEPIELQKMYRLEDTYWWFISRRRLVKRLIERYVPPAADRRLLLDVGCGTGATLRVLDEFGTVVGVDRSEEALRLSATRGKFALVQASADSLPFPDDTFDVVTALDLLEHLDDDQTAMREIDRVLRPGGIAVLTLPAYPFLWSEHDVALDHRRRYMASDCRRLLQAASLRIVRLTCAIVLLFPPIFAFRLWQQVFNPVERSQAQTALRVLPPAVNHLLIRLLDLETSLLLRMNLPVGVSLVVVAQKPVEPPENETVG